MVGGVVPVVGAVAADVRGQEGVVVGTGTGLQLVNILYKVFAFKIFRLKYR